MIERKLLNPFFPIRDRDELTVVRMCSRSEYEIVVSDSKNSVSSLRNKIGGWIPDDDTDIQGWYKMSVAMNTILRLSV